MNNGNNDFLVEASKIGFSFLSFKVKAIVIAVVITLFLVILIPIVALSSINRVDNTQKKGGSSGTTSSGGVTVSVDTKKYENASFIMPFESWDSSKDLVTSSFGYRSDPFTRKTCFSFWNRFSCYKQSKPKNMCSSKWFSNNENL